MKKLSIRAKLLVSLGVPLLLLIGIVVALFAYAKVVEQRVRESRTERLVLANTAHEMKLDAVQVQQWLTDISATRAKDGLDDGFKLAAAHRESFQAGLEKFRSRLGASGGRDALQRIDVIAVAFEEYYAMGVTMAKSYIDGGPEAGNKLMGSFDKSAEKMTNALDPFLDEQKNALEENLVAVETSTIRMRTILLVAGALNLIVSLALLVAAIRSIVRPIQSAVSSLSLGAEQTAAAARQVSGASQDLAAGASKQAAALEETSAGVSEMSGSTSRNSASTASASDLVRKTRTAADSSTVALQGMGAAMEEIRRSSEDIRAINKTIDEIAFQTNILALNAAVEAARAGAAGSGFAVVAEEVRNLAQRSARAAHETSEKIDAATARAANGVEVTARVLHELEAIVAQVREIDGLMGGINGATHDQSRGLAEISRAIEEMNGVTQANAATAEEAASASEELDGQAEVMHAVAQDLVGLVMGGRAVTSSAVAHAPRGAAAPARETVPANRIGSPTSAPLVPV